MIRLVCHIALFFAVTAACSQPKVSGPVNPGATPETRTLYRNLETLRHSKTLFGHQDDMAYGVHWWAEERRSDVKDVTGSYPAVFGYELGDLEKDSLQNLDRVRFDNMQRWIVQGHAVGGLITLSWHADNPVTGGSSWDTTAAVYAILPGGMHHEMFKGWLDRFAVFVSALKDGNGRPIPIVFRPWHENTGAWFWWGRTHCSPEEYKALWVFTFDYLTREKKLNNLLWAWSPAEKHLEAEFDLWYPGDALVDIIGKDDYGTWAHGENAVAQMSASLGWLVEKAEAHGKIPVFGETGSEALKNPKWFTEALLPALTLDERARRLAWVMLWRNANSATDRKDHFYVPFPGHPAADDFTAFRNNPRMAFAGDVTLYQP